ncbi:MAG: DUF427 domain-containing protein [Proteobacteria bacterium]|nr:DUF427 domain-containing protein [Burkholderiales bacterium]
MTLMYGSAPFGPDPAGTFNFERKEPAIVLYWEDYPKRFRVEVAGKMVADSRRAKALHETGQMMRVCLPGADVRLDLLETSGTSRKSAATGTAKCWSMRMGDRLVENVAWSYDDPPPSAPPLQGYVSFDLDAVDAWHEEDDKGYAHPRDPYHRFDLHNAARRVVVRLGDVEVARSERPKLLFETGLPPRYYLPPEDIRIDLLEKSSMVSECPYKGDGQHWHVVTGDTRIEDAAWSLPAPLGEAVAIAGWICFYPDKMHVEVDDGVQSA